MLQVLLNSLIVGSIYSLIALGFNFIYGPTKFFNLAHGAVILIGGFSFLEMVNRLDMDPILAFILALLISGLAGLLMEKIVYLPLRKRGVSNIVLLVSSLGLLTILQPLLALLFGRRFRTFPEYDVFSKVFHFGGGTITSFQIILIAVSIVVTLVLAYVLRKTTFGKSVRAISDDIEVATIMGIHTNKVIAIVFFIGSVIAGLAGMMIGFDTGFGPSMGLVLLLKGIIAAIIGGFGNIYGGILGAYMLAIFENLAAWQFSGEWRDTTAFILLIIFLIFRPYGLFNVKQNQKF